MSTVPRSLPSPTFRSMPRSVGAVVAVAVVATAALVVLVPLTATADPVDPLVDDALLQVRGDASLIETVVEGPVAVGGDLSFSGPVEVTDALLVQGGPDPDGAVDWDASSGGLAVLGAGGTGTVTLGDGTGTGIDDSGPTILLTPADGDPPGTAIIGDADQSAESVVDPSLDVVSRFDDPSTGYLAVSAELALCEPDTVVVEEEGRTTRLILQDGYTNVWTVDEPTLDEIRRLRLDPMPSPSTQLVINITGAGGAPSTDLSLPRLLGPGRVAAAPHILWNVVGSGALRMTEAWHVFGTVYAPGFHLVDHNPKDIYGGVVADSFGVELRASGEDAGRIRPYPFEGELDCGNEVPRPTETEGTGTSTQASTETSMETGTSGSSSAPSTSEAEDTSSTSPEQSESSSTTGGGETSTGSSSAETSGSDTVTVTSGPTTGDEGTSSTPTSGTDSTGSTLTSTDTESSQSTSATSTSATSTSSADGTTGTTSSGEDGSTAAESSSSSTSGSSGSPTDPDEDTSGSSTTGSTGSGASTGSTTSEPGESSSPSGGEGSGTASDSASSPSGEPSGEPTDDDTATEGSVESGTGGDPSTPVSGATSVGDPGSGTSVAGATTGGAGPGGLALSGADVAGLLLTALGLLCAGVGMLWTGRRQARGRHVS